MVLFCFFIETRLYGTTISKKHLVQLRHALDFHSVFSGLLGIFLNTSTANHFIWLLRCEQLCQSSLFFFHFFIQCLKFEQRTWNGDTRLDEKFLSQRASALNCTVVASRDELNVFTTEPQIRFSYSGVPSRSHVSLTGSALKPNPEVVMPLHGA